MRILAIFLMLGLHPLFAEELLELEESSMLFQAKNLAKEYSGNKRQWQHPYGVSQPEKAVSMASVWFEANPSALITKKQKSPLQLLASTDLWRLFQEMGVTGLYTGQVQLTGKGNWDPISFGIDPLIGTLDEYLYLAKTAKSYNGILIGEVIPGHTGIGPDFQLALKNYQDYPGLYHMVEIEQQDWVLLPKKPEGNANLSMKDLDYLRKRGYIPGDLERADYLSPCVQNSHWDATPEIMGVDGINRRWIYLHALDKDQPDLNFLDPSLSAERLISGSIMDSLGVLQNSMVHLAADTFQTLEKQYCRRVWSKAHPLSLTTTELFAELVRKLGGFSFATLNMPLENIQIFSTYGADLHFDYLLSYALLDALIHANAEFLSACYNKLSEYDLKPMQFIHALQSQDEFNDELVQLRQANEERWTYHGKEYSTSGLHEEVREENRKLLLSLSYNDADNNGFQTTLVGLIAAALKMPNVYSLTDAAIEKIKKAHLLLAHVQALQPGVFAFSGRDLVGSLPLQNKAKGAFDLMGEGNGECTSSFGLPKAKALYGPLPKQLKDPTSFASQLKAIIKIRKNYGIDQAELIKVIRPQNQAVFLLLHRLPGTKYLQLTAANFSDAPLTEELEIDGAQNTSAINLYTRQSESKPYESQKITLKFAPLEGKAILFQPKYFQD